MSSDSICSSSRYVSNTPGLKLFDDDGDDHDTA